MPRAVASHIRFNCPGCSRSYRAPARLAGKQVSCSNCETLILLSPTGSRRLPKVESKPRTLRWIVVAIGALSALLVAL